VRPRGAKGRKLQPGKSKGKLGMFLAVKQKKKRGVGFGKKDRPVSKVVQGGKKNRKGEQDPMAAEA